MRKRLTNWRPVSTKIKGAISNRHRERFARIPVGKNQELGPSILNPQVFSVDKDSVEYGTRVQHASYYEGWRKRELGDELLDVDAKLKKKIARVVLRHTIRGTR